VSPEPTQEPAATLEPVATVGPETADRDFAPVAAEIEAFVNERGLNGAGIVVVHRDEGEIYRDYFGEFSEDRISLIASSSKMISAGVLLKLHEDGALDIDMPLRDYIDWADPKSDITAAQLMSNSSGLVGLGPNLLYGPYICQRLPTEELESCGEAVLSGTADDADVIAPDTEFRYGGAQWQVAGAVAETVSGKPWSELVNEIYVEPCGLDSLGYISLGSVASSARGYPTAFGGDPDGVDATENPNIEGGAYITTSEYGELLLMHLRGGVCGETQVLSSDSLDTMHADRIDAAYGGSAWPNTGYGMGWWVDRQTGRISDGGAFGTVPWLDLDDGYGVYLVIEDTSDAGRELAGRIEDLIHTTVAG
jgi:CubicO group peptidase (beta-lactamase class C family)